MLRFCWILLLHFTLFGAAKSTLGGLNDTIFSIFQIGPEPGVHIFNTTPVVISLNSTKSTITSALKLHNGANIRNDPNPNQKLNHKQHLNQNHNRDEPFKVQRAPDGKLNLVFNEFPYLQPVTEAPNPQQQEVRDFVYPDQLNKLTEPKCGDPNSASKPFCTKVLNYPDKQQLDNILKPDLSKFSIFFGEDLIQPVNISQRMDNDIDEEYFCRSVQKTIYPESGITRNADWLLIVNKYKEYKQGVVVEECAEEGASCDIFQSIPFQYKTWCKQHYSYRPLLAILDGKVVQELFKLPSCCKCVYKQQDITSKKN